MDSLLPYILVAVVGALIIVLSYKKARGRS